MRTAPVSEGRSATTRGEDLSRFPHRRSFFAISGRNVIAQDVAAKSPKIVPVVQLPDLSEPRDVFGLQAELQQSSCRSLATKLLGFLTHLKPPTRGTVTAPTLAHAEAECLRDLIRRLERKQAA